MNYNKAAEEQRIKNILSWISDAQIVHHVANYKNPDGSIDLPVPFLSEDDLEAIKWRLDEIRSGGFTPSFTTTTHESTSGVEHSSCYLRLIPSKD